MKKSFWILQIGCVFMISELIVSTSFAQTGKSKIDPVLFSIFPNQVFSQEEIQAEIDRYRAAMQNYEGQIKVASLHAASLARVFFIDLDEPDPEISVIMKYKGEIEELEAIGIDVQLEIGDLVTAHFPISKLRELAQRPDVGRIELGKPMEVELDTSAVKVNARQIVNGESIRNTLGFDGEGVIIGIIDTGIDLTHEDFRNPDGTTRVLYVWDQLSEDGNPPSFYNPLSYDYGSEWLPCRDQRSAQ